MVIVHYCHSSKCHYKELSWRLPHSSAFGEKHICDFFQQTLTEEIKLRSAPRAVGCGLQRGWRLALLVPKAEDARPVPELLGAKPEPELGLNQNGEQEKGHGY